MAFIIHFTMKYILQIACITLLFAACNTKKSEAIPTGVLKQRYLPVIKGSWVAKDYVDDIEKTKSPVASYTKLEGVAAIIITDKVKDDKIAARVSFNNHDAINLSVFAKKGRTPNSLTTNYVNTDTADKYDLEYTVTPTDTILTLRSYNRDGKEITAKKFVRVNSNTVKDDAGSGIQFTVNKQVLYGTYMVEGTQPPLTVTFKNNGSVTGFEDFDAYLVGTDFSYNDPDEILGSDYIYFEKKGDDNYFSYDFKIKADTLILSQHGTHYKLVKQHKQ